MKKTLFLVRCAAVAAIYFVLTFLFQPISFGIVQFRIAEILTILPFFMPEAIPGLFVGCLLSNIVGGNGLADVIVGSLATLIAAFMTYKIRRPYLAPLPPVLVNVVLVGPMLSVVLGQPLWLAMGSLLLGQGVVCYVGGLPLLYLLQKVPFFANGGKLRS